MIIKNFRSKIVILISCLICSSCTNISMQLPDEVDWVYFNKKMFDNALGGYMCEYQINIKDSVIFVKSFCSEECDIINSKGILIDTAIYDTILFKINMEYIGGSKMYVWETWNFSVNYLDKSRISKLNYITRPTERLKLLSRRRPKREHFIEYVLDNKNYYVKLPSASSFNVIYNVCQYDKTKFLFSMDMRIKDVEYRPSHNSSYCFVMIDLEDLSRKRFLGIKL